MAERIINRNLEGYGAIDPVNKDKTLATPKGQSDFEPLREAGTYKPLVTYISRQSSRRRLTKESHEELVKAVQERSEKVGFEFKVVEAEKLTQEEQFSLAARTTVGPEPASYSILADDLPYCRSCSACMGMD